MIRQPKRLALAVLLCGALVLNLAAGEQPAPPPAAKPSVAELIEQLNSRDFKKREAATRALMQRDDALPALRQALKSPHAETRRRAAEILDQKANGAKRRALKQVLASIKKGQGFQTLRLLTANPECGDVAWQPLLDLITSVTVEGQKKYELQFLVPFLTDVPYRRTFAPKRKGLGSEKSPFDRRVVTKGGTDRYMITRSEIICGGPLRVQLRFSENIVLANGDVTVQGSIVESVVLCNGNITTNEAAVNSVLIATGTVKVNNTFHNPSSLILEHADLRGDLRRLRFFDLERVGVEVAAEKGGLVVKKVLLGKPFAVAGVRVGDHLLALTGVPLKDEAHLCRELRRRITLGARVTLTVGRAGKKLGLTVPPAD
jgi:hypothetical protein